MIYAVLGCLWILLSDKLLTVMVTDQETVTRISIYKGWIYVVLSAALIYYLVGRALRRTRQAQDALQESENRFRLVVDKAVDPIFLYDEDGGILDVNQAACDSLGYTREELLKLDISDFDPQVVPGRHREIFWDKLRQGRSFRFETQHRRRDGTLFPVEVSLGSLDLGKGRLILSLARDITERRRAEAELRKKTEELDRYFNNSLDLLCIADTTGRFRRLNPEWERTLGYSLSELEGRQFLELVHPDDLEATKAALKNLAQSREVLNLVNRYRCKNGGYRWIEWRSYPEGELIYAVARDITRHMQVMDDLSESEGRFRALTEESPLGISLIDRLGRYEYLNPAFIAMFGYTLSDLPTGRDWFRMAYPDPAYREEVLAAWREDLRLYPAGESRPRIYTVRCKDGGNKVVMFRPVTLASQRQFVIYEDITERVRAEETLKTNQVRQGLAMEMAKLVYWEYDAGERVFIFDDQFYALYGTTAAEQGGDRMSAEEYARRFIPPEEVSIVEEELAKALACREPRYFNQLEHRMLRADGQERFISVRFALVKDEAGRAVKVYGANQDITERKQAEEALRLSEEKFSKAFRASPVLVAVTTVEEGRFQEVNDAFSTVTGVSREEAIGKTSLDLGFWLDPEKDRPRVMEIFHREGYFHNLEIPMRYRDGKVHTMLWSADPIEFEGRECLINVLVDITEKKEAQDENARLEAQLRQAQKMEAIGTLAGGIAHDFNNILGVIMGYTELAQNLSQNGMSNERELTQVLRATDRARDLVRQILTFSRKAEVDQRPINLNYAVEQSLRILRHSLPKMITIETHLASDLELINADPNQMEQVLMNLATNAADAMPGGGTLVIESQNITLDNDYAVQHLDLNPGPYVLLTVSDTGCGIDPRTLEHIFDPFFTTKDLGKGTGLGLSMVYGIVRAQGGHVHCYSEPGMGATFKVYLPAYRGEAAAVAPEVSVAEHLLVGTETVLLVDDETDMRNLGSLTLEEMGYRTLTASSGEEALDIYRERGAEIDLVVLDLGMPGIGGQRCLSEILALNPKARVVIASGYSANGQVKASLESGAAGYIAKPFRRVDLLATVRGVLDRD